MGTTSDESDAESDVPGGADPNAAEPESGRRLIVKARRSAIAQGEGLVTYVVAAVPLAAATAAVAREAICQRGETRREELRQEGETTRAALTGGLALKKEIEPPEAD